MIALAHLVLAASVILGVIAASHWPRYRVVLGIFVLGELFLPEIRSYSVLSEMPEPLGLPGFKLTKINAMSYGALMASLFYDRQRWAAFRIRWFDVPIALWCICPFFTSLVNGLFYDEPPPLNLGGQLPGTIHSLFRYVEHIRLYDGFAQALDQTMAWGVPYILGRLYFGDLEKLRVLATAIFLGGVLYMPFCLIEIRLSPQLHFLVYGFYQHDFAQSVRFEGYRPTVFMEHGLEVGLFMVCATLLGFWMWRAQAFAQFRKTQALLGTLVAGLGLTCVLCKSTGALVLGVLGLAALLTFRWGRIPLIYGALLLVPLLYISTRSTNAWDGEDLVAFLQTDFNDDRAESLGFRFRNEDLLREKAMERPLLGWGGWGRSQLYDEYGEKLTISDGMWIIALGDRGFVGLAALFVSLVLPSTLFVWQFPPRRWAQPRFAPAAGLAVVLLLWSIDCLLNAMLNPVYLLALGGLMSLNRPRGPGLASSARVEFTGHRKKRTAMNTTSLV